MKVEIWLDYACQKSYMTHKNLMEAIQEQSFEVEVLYRSYIVPSLEECIDKGIEKIIKKENPLYVPLESANTIYAHCLARLAKKYQMCVKTNKAIFDAFYLHNLDISDPNTIYQIADQVGLSSILLKEKIENKTFKPAIEQNYINAIAKKINKIPHIRINGNINLSGYQDKETIALILKEEYIKESHQNFCYGKYCEKGLIIK